MRDVYTVTRLNQEVRSTIEGNFPTLWVEGEISNLARPRSGHLYFSLKDEQCQIRCAMFRTHNQHVGFVLEDGAKVLARARASIYLQRGDFQLIVEYLEEAGEGALRQAFEILKRRLAAEGLFESSHKRQLPVIPKQIGVITSPSGAAIRDILTVLKRRFPGVPVLLYPASVQGREAPQEITHMLDLANRRQECDVLILARGGGSLEDLQSFNEEMVARAIYRCEIPVVSAIGHEVDFTIADFVADQRAPTPSAAAERVVPDQQEWQQKITMLSNRLVTSMHRGLTERRQEMSWLEKRLIHPQRRLQDDAQRIDDLMRRLMQCAHSFSSLRKNRVMELTARLHRYEPSARLQSHNGHLRQLQHRLVNATKQPIYEHKAHLSSLTRTLDAINPQRTLERGYAIVTSSLDKEVLYDTASTIAGDQIHVRLSRGKLFCTVLQAEGKEPDSHPVDRTENSWN